jgi:nuclear cap-binding protein subunit 1
VRKVEDDVASIAKTVAENYFDSDLTGAFLDLVLQLYVHRSNMVGRPADPAFRTVEQPLKIPFIAAIVLIANIQKPEFTTEILQKVGNALQSRLETGSWREVKLYLRFLGCLQGLFENEGIFAILEDLFSRAVELQTQSSEDVSIIYCFTATTS